LIKNILRKIDRARNKLGEKGLKILIPNKIIEIVEKQIPEFVNIDGQKIFLARKGPVSIKLHQIGIWEENETKLIKKEIHKDEVVLDIGANIGYYSLIFAKLVGPQGKIFSFEPEPSNFNLLKKNIEVNNFQNVTVERMAVSDENGKTKLFLSEKDSGQHRIYQCKSISNNYVSVDKITLDDYFKNNSLAEKISFVKMDVEGSELGVLKGMKSILNKNYHLKLILEFSPLHLKEFGVNPGDVLKFLKAYDFNFYLIDSNGLKPATEDSLLEIPLGSEVNIFCKRN